MSRSAWTVVHWNYHFGQPLTRFRSALESKYLANNPKYPPTAFFKAWEPASKFLDRARDLEAGKSDFSLLPAPFIDGKIRSVYRQLTVSGWVGYYEILHKGYAAGILSMELNQSKLNLLADLQNIKPP